MSLKVQLSQTTWYQQYITTTIATMLNILMNEWMTEWVNHSIIKTQAAVKLIVNPPLGGVLNCVMATLDGIVTADFFPEGVLKSIHTIIVPYSQAYVVYTK